MKHAISPLALCLCLALAPMPAPAQENEAAAVKSITLPLPAGQKMEFVLVRVTEDENAFSSVAFQVGKDLQASYDERLAQTSVSGTVCVPEHGSHAAYWAIPMGRTEVTRAQYAAIMTPNAMPKPAEADLPQTNVSYADIQAFIDKLNEWLLKDKESPAAKALRSVGSPRVHGMPYARLPLESEWEFAARGGGFVSPERLKEDIPYEDQNELAASENVYVDGNEKLRPVGYKKATNPAGLYDMFGNVREMVEGVFRPEYHFGRVGGLLIRGGCFLDQNVSSYTRREVVPVDAKGAPFKSSEVGFRLVLGSSILSGGMKGQRIEDEWSEYVDGLVPVAAPGSSPTDSLEKNMDQERQDIARQLGEMAAKMAAMTGQDVGTADFSKLENMLSSMGSQLQEMEKKVRASQATSAQAALQMMYFASREAAKNSADIATQRVRLENKSLSPEARALFLRNIKILEDNVPTYWASFSKGCVALKDVDARVVDEQVQMRLKEMQLAGATNEAKRAQIPIFMHAVQVFKKYLSTGRLSKPECDEWYEELKRLTQRNPARETSS